MATRYTPLWLDPFENKLYSDWQNTQPAPTLSFKQGDKQDFELFLVKKGIGGTTQEAVPFPSGCTIRFAIGKLDTAPTAGTIAISYGGDTTAELDYDSTASEIQTAINALPSVIAAGGVVVTTISGTTRRVEFNNVGTRTLLGVDSSGCSPTSSSKVITARAGSLTAKAIYIFKVYQSVAVYQDTWTDSAEPTLTVTTLQSNLSKRVEISPTPLSGSWSLTATNAIQPLVDDAGGDTTDVPTYWTQTKTSRLDAFASPPFLNTDGTPIWQMDVLRIGMNTWDFTMKSDYDLPVGYTMPFTATGNFVKFPSKVANIDFNTVEVEYLLNGSATATAYLEIELEKSTGERWTLLQTTCTIVNDLIDQESYSPNSYEEVLGDAPYDGSAYLRKDGGWVTDVDGGTY